MYIYQYIYFPYIQLFSPIAQLLPPIRIDVGLNYAQCCAILWLEKVYL